MIDRLAMTTDFVSGKGDPLPALRQIADAGFRHVHWCHQWNTDFAYGDAELRAIGDALRELGLSVNDIHGSQGLEKAWESPIERQRQAGVELVANRLDMAARLSCHVVVMHAVQPEAEGERAAYWARLRRSLDELRPLAASRGVRIALENLPEEKFDTVDRALGLYGPDFLGLCYDSGHGNLTPGGLDRLERLKGRLIALHLHDNDGAADKHWLPFAGTVDWPRLAGIIAASGYARSVMTLESNMRQDDEGAPEVWLRRAAEAGSRFAQMVERARP
jgi:sugar phosphate isomerase/epimerase